MPDDKQSHFISMMRSATSSSAVTVPRSSQSRDEANVVREGKDKLARREMAVEQTQRIKDELFTFSQLVFYFGYSCYFVSEIFVCCDRTCLPSMMRMKMAFCRSRRSSNTLKARYAVHLQSVFAGNKSGMNQCTSWFFPELEWIQVNLNSRLRSPAWQLDRVRVLPLPSITHWLHFDGGILTLAEDCSWPSIQGQALEKLGDSRLDFAMELHGLAIFRVHNICQVLTLARISVFPNCT